MRPPRDRHAGERAAEEAALLELATIYREVDARFAGWSCDASTTCCRFGLTGREPYVTAVEVLAVRRALARTGRKPDSPRAGARRTLPLSRERDERRCPALDPEGRCTVYSSRPLGCRTYFCDRALPGAPVPQRDVNAFVARLRAVSERLGPGGGEGRPLTRALALGER